MSTLEEQTAAALSLADLELIAATQVAEEQMTNALAGQEAVLTAAQNIQRLQASLAALKGEVPAPTPAAPIVPGSSAIVSGSVADALASRTTDFGEHPPAAQADAAGNVLRVPGQETGYALQPQAPVAQVPVIPGQTVRKRRDNQAALAESQNRGPQCPGCGKFGTIAQYQKSIGDRGPFIFIGCQSCGSERMVG